MLSGPPKERFLPVPAAACLSGPPTLRIERDSAITLPPGARCRRAPTRPVELPKVPIACGAYQRFRPSIAKAAVEDPASFSQVTERYGHHARPSTHRAAEP